MFILYLNLTVYTFIHFYPFNLSPALQDVHLSFNIVHDKQLSSQATHLSPYTIYSNEEPTEIISLMNPFAHTLHVELSRQVEHGDMQGEHKVLFKKKP